RASRHRARCSSLWATAPVREHGNGLGQESRAAARVAPGGLEKNRPSTCEKYELLANADRRRGACGKSSRPKCHPDRASPGFASVTMRHVARGWLWPAASTLDAWNARPLLTRVDVREPYPAEANVVLRSVPLDCAHARRFYRGCYSIDYCEARSSTPGRG